MSLIINVINRIPWWGWVIMWTWNIIWIFLAGSLMTGIMME